MADHLPKLASRRGIVYLERLFRASLCRLGWATRGHWPLLGRSNVRLVRRETDKLLDSAAIVSRLADLCAQLDARLDENCDLAAGRHEEMAQRVNRTANEVLLETRGFDLQVKQSRIPDSGQGVFVNRGVIRRGEVAAFYPGTVYAPGEGILLQSIRNRFILRCEDGMLVDGKHNGLSGHVYIVCMRRDSLIPPPRSAGEFAWQYMLPCNPLFVGQMVNNCQSSSADTGPLYSSSATDLGDRAVSQSSNANTGPTLSSSATDISNEGPLHYSSANEGPSHRNSANGQRPSLHNSATATDGEGPSNSNSATFSANVAYHEAALRYADFPFKWRKFVGNLPFSHDNGLDSLKLVALVALRDIQAGEELYSNYMTVISEQ